MAEFSKETCINLTLSLTSKLGKTLFSEQVAWSSSHGFEDDINEFLDGSILRTVSLLEDTATLLANGRLLGATATARASLETLALMLEFIRKFKASIARGDSNDLKNLTRSFIFSSLEFNKETGIKTPNVMDALRTAEKLVNGTIGAYSVLCEAVHPNWVGRSVSIGDGDFDWSKPDAQRLMIAIMLTASLTNTINTECAAFCEFIAKNKKNIRNIALFGE